jgi:hypothetical protein
MHPKFFSYWVDNISEDGFGRFLWWGNKNFYICRIGNEFHRWI